MRNFTQNPFTDEEFKTLATKLGFKDESFTDDRGRLMFGMEGGPDTMRKLIAALDDEWNPMTTKVMLVAVGSGSPSIEIIRDHEDDTFCIAKADWLTD